MSDHEWSVVPAAQPQQAQATIAPGWYPDPSTGMTRWWDGRQWTPHYAPAPQPQIQPVAAHPAGGPQVVMQAPYTMVTTSKKHTSHGLHLFLTIMTGGLWAVFIWIPLTIWHKSTRDKQVTRVGY